MNPWRTHYCRVSAIAFVLITILSCTSPQDPSVPSMAAAAGKVSGVTVKAADPSYAHRGDVQKQVTITGTGFEPGAVASWQRNGVDDPKIQVQSTQFLNSTTVIATINVAQDAALDYYDVAIINPNRKGGIGTTLFEVTLATPVPGSSILRGVNENGLLGFGLAPGGYWSESGGYVALPDIPPTGGGVWAIDEAGVTMTGFEYPSSGMIPVWSFVSGAWVESILQGDPAATGGLARAIASDPTTGVAVYIGGTESFTVKNQAIHKPRLWHRGIAGWERVVLPSLSPDGRGTVEDVTPNGTAVGNVNARAVIWEPDGAGGWSVAYLPGTEINARGINSAGTLIGGGALGYWQRPAGGSWTLSQLATSCARIRAVDDLGRMVVAGCPWKASSTRAAVFAPPYTDPPMYLGTLGHGHTNVNIEYMSLRGSWIVGQTTEGGVYWKLF